MTFSNVTFHLTQNPPNVQFTIIEYREKQKMLQNEKLEIMNVWHFCLMNKFISIIISASSFSVDQLIDQINKSFRHEFLVQN